MSAPQLRVISLGAGVQSTAMALLAARGEITPMPDCAIFADTGWEPRAVYEHLRWLMSPHVLPFPVHVVSAGNIRDDIVAAATIGGDRRFVSIPWFLRTVKPNGGYTIGMGRRQCTKEYKLAPIAKGLRRLLRCPGRAFIPPGAVEIWIGISTDEASRMKPPRQRYQVGRWPLLEKGMSRHDCLRWLQAHGYPPPPKSACIGCPFRSNESWRALKESSPDEFADAALVDRVNRNPAPRRGMRSGQEVFMHKSCRPLEEVDFTTLDDGQANLFENECEGMCGV